MHRVSGTPVSFISLEITKGGFVNIYSTIRIFIALSLMLIFVWPSVGFSKSSGAVPKMVVGHGPQKMKIGLDPGTFPPFTSGPFQGIDFEVLKAVCAANRTMKCEFQLRAFSECSMGEGVGQALEHGTVDGCINWVATAPRKAQGFEFANSYHTSSPPQLICVADLENSLTCATAPEINGMGLLNLNNATVGFVSGFFAAPACLNDIYDDGTYTVFKENGENPILSESELECRLNKGDIDYGVWVTTNPVPDGTILAGAEVPSCGSENSLLLYPPSTGRPHQSDTLRREWNCGLALVRQTPELLTDLLTALENELGRAPLNPEEFIQDGPVPTVQCLEGNNLVID
jgi:hypothetical protein